MRPVDGHRLDSEPMQRLHGSLLSHYTTELDRQGPNRQEMAIDEGFYDNEQWRDADKAILEERGQIPLVYNVISASVDWVIGTQARTRTDYKILPRRKTDSQPAQRKSELLKYLSDCNHTTFHESRAFEDAVKVGIGWIEDGLADDGEEEPLYTRSESWRNVLFDSFSSEIDTDKGRYVFRTKWFDLDIAKAMFPRRTALIDRSADAASELDVYGDDEMDSQENELDQASRRRRNNDETGTGYRGRVRLIEAWFRIPTTVEKMSGGSFAGEIYDPASRGHKDDIDSGEAEIVTKVTMRVHVAIMTTSGLLYFGVSPYRHNRYPLTAIWGYRRGKDNMPYGMIRRIRDIQEDVNKRASKALHILSTNKIIMDKGAVDDIDELVEEAARPDAVIVKNPNKFLELDADRDISQWHLELMSRSIAMIQQSSGVTDEQLGRRTNASSGIAIQRRQDQGTMATWKFFDNLRHAKLILGEKRLSMIEQFITERKAFRITDMRGRPNYVEVNDGLPENDIARSKADYVISEQDWNASMRQASAEALLELLGKLAPVAPQVVMVMIDLVIESMDLPNREELVKRIRQVTGQRDPDQEEPTQEEVQREQAAAENEQMQKAMLQADLQKKLAEAKRLQAQAEEIAAKMVGGNVEAQKKAMEAAMQVTAAPVAAPIADHILHESGFRSRTDLEEEAAEMPPAPPSAQPALPA